MHELTHRAYGLSAGRPAFNTRESVASIFHALKYTAFGSIPIACATWWATEQVNWNPNLRLFVTLGSFLLAEQLLPTAQRQYAYNPDEQHARDQAAQYMDDTNVAALAVHLMRGDTVA